MCEPEVVELDPVEPEIIAASVVPGSYAAVHKELHLPSSASSNLANPSFPFVAFLAKIVQFLDETETLEPSQISVSAKLKVGIAK